VLHLPVNIGGIPAGNVRALRRLGVDARHLMFHEPKLRSDRPDIVLDTTGSFARRQLVQVRALARVLPQTDLFHFYFGLTLVPKRVQFPILRLARKKSIFHFLGSDIRGKTPAQLAYANRADARIVGSYDAARWVPDADVVPPPIDTAAVTPVPPSSRSRPLVVHAPSSRRRKGTEHVVAACARLPVELDVVEGVKHDEAVRRVARADIVVDQLNAGWYGIAALEAMALGKPVVTFLHEEAVARTEEAFGVQVPIVGATKDTLAEQLIPLVESSEERLRRGAASRAYVERVHDLDSVGHRLLSIYQRI
jgi:glycosyltransferase involved in cell wall biosynthesis